MLECYELVLKHYIVNRATGERFQIEEPIAVAQAFDYRYGGTPIDISRMLDEVKSYLLARMDGEQNG